MPSPTKLASLLEGVESPSNRSENEIDTLLSSPVAPPNTAVLKRTSQIKFSPLKTPKTTSRFRPGLEEMHPSKAHSAVKLGRSASRFRLQGSEPLLRAPELISSSTGIEEGTPTKSKGSLPSHMSSPKFEFSLARPDVHLSAQTQQIMDSVREEAAKIKADMQAEREKQDLKDEEADQLRGLRGRKIAKARGKAGRFSEVHMQEFKKMDSIAGHASTWRFQQPTSSSLKRGNSKARLTPDEPEGAAGTKRSMTFRSDDDDRLENVAPGKRAKKDHHHDASAARQLSGDESSEDGSIRPIHPKCLPSAFATPTRASVARSASVKQMKTMIPSLFLTPSGKVIQSPTHPRTEGSQKYFSLLPGFSRMKSILHRHQPKVSNDSVDVARTQIPAPQKILNYDIGLQSQPGTPVPKRVEFSASTNARYELAAVSPSPSKIAKLQLYRPASPFPGSEPVLYPSLSNTNSRHELAKESSSTLSFAEQLRRPSSPLPASEPGLYPVLTNSPDITTRTARRSSKPLNSGDFSFRADKPMPSPGTILLSPTKKATTIRQVRPSGIVTPVTAFENLPTIPHGMPNKKRRRADSDDEAENIAPVTNAEEEEHEDGPWAKKLKRSPQKPLPPAGKNKTSRGGGRAIPKPAAGKGRDKAKRVLSVSRLNMLAKPKSRG